MALNRMPARAFSDSELLTTIADELDKAKRQEMEGGERMVLITDTFAKLVSNAIRSIGARVRSQGMATGMKEHARRI